MTAKDAARTYGAANPTFTGGISGGVNNDSFTESFTTAATPSSAIGAYAIVPSAAGANLKNYTQTAANGVLTINPALLTLSAENATRVYGAVNPVFTGSVKGLLNGDQVQQSFTTDAAPGSPVGSYSITPSASGTALVNYHVQSVNTGVLTVTSAALRLSANDAARPYGTDNPTFTGTLAGAVGSDVLSEQFTTAATRASAPGTYPIVPSVQGSAVANYSSTAANGTLTVTAAPLTASVENATRLYGTANPSFTGSITGAANNEAFTETFATTATVQSPVGIYAVKPALAGATMAYYTPVLLDGTLTVAPAALTATAASATRSYGMPNPTLTGTLTGIVNGDTLTASYTTAAKITDAPGQYPILSSVSGGALGNYNLTPIAGVLTIEKAASSTTLTQQAESDGSIQLQVYVQSAAAGVPSGTVRFFNGSLELGKSTLESGTASLQTKQFQAGASNPLIAVYEGDPDFLTSTSDTLAVQVQATGFGITVAPSASAPVLSSGASTNFSLQASPGNTGMYPGIVTFSVAGLPVGATATFSPATLAADSGAQIVTMSVQMAGKQPVTTGLSAAGSISRRVEPALGGAVLALVMLPLAGARRLRKAGRGMTLSLLLLLAALGAGSVLTGCGVATTQNGWHDSAPTSYALTITMTSGGVAHSTTTTLTLQP